MEPGLEHRGAEARDWSDWGSSGLGLERPGLRKEGDMVGENNGEEHMNRGKDQMRKDTTKESQEAGGEGTDGKAAKHVEPGREQPGKQRTRDWNIRGRGGPGWELPGLQEEDEAAAARTGKESKYKNRGRGRTRTRRARGGKREEKERNERRMGTWNPDTCG